MIEFFHYCNIFSLSLWVILLMVFSDSLRFIRVGGFGARCIQGVDHSVLNLIHSVTTNRCNPAKK